MEQWDAGTAAVSCLEYDNEGALYLAGTDVFCLTKDVQGKITVRRPPGGTSCHQPHQKGINDIYLSPEFLLTASDDCTVSLTGLPDFTVRASFPHHHAPVTCVAGNPHTSLIASGGYDENVHIFSATTLQHVKVLPAHADPVTSVGFSPDARLLVTSSYDGLVRIWDGRSGLVIRTMIGDGGNPAITSALFSEDGDKVLAAGLDSRICVWEVRTGKLAGTLKGHENRKYIIRPRLVDGDVFMGSEDGSVHRYTLATGGHQSQSVFDPDEPLLNLAIYRNEVMSVSGLNTSTVKFIKL